MPSFLFLFFIFIISYFHMCPLGIIGKQFKYLYKVSIKWDIIKQENALCEMPLNAYALSISYIIKAIFNNQIGLEMIMSYMYICI